MLGEIDGPDPVGRAGGVDAVWMAPGRGAPLPEVAQELRHVGLADRPALFGMITIEQRRDHSATGIGRCHRDLEQDFTHFNGFGERAACVSGMHRPASLQAMDACRMSGLVA